MKQKKGFTKVEAPAKWAELLRSAVTQPGELSAAYRAFHNYSFGNMILAWWQCCERSIPLGPIAPFRKWKEYGRHVRKGEKAIVLCMPLTVKVRSDESDQGAAAAADDSDSGYRTVFAYKRNWFVLAQTDGAEYQPPAVPAWDRARALAELKVDEVPYSSLNGNSQGYAKPAEREGAAGEIAVNPLAFNPAKTTFHELAHVVLGHTAELVSDKGQRTPQELREVEAEAVAMLLLDTLGLDGAKHCRGYIQNWWGQGREIPEANARRIFQAADKILRAGQQAAGGAQ